MSVPAISTPCVKICVIDPVSALCIGCGRTPEEIARWGAMSEDERRAVMARLEARLIGMRARGARAGRAASRRRGS